MNLPSWKVRAGVSAAALILALIPAPQAHAQLGPPSTGRGGGGGGGNLPPSIVGLTAEQVPGRKFRISGRVADETPGNCGVVITGAATGALHCDSGGNFSAVLDVPNLGQIMAIASDGQLQSQMAYLRLNNTAPTIGGFTAVGGANNTWTFSGSVGDEAPEGLTVTLSGPTGVQGATATVGAGGAWSVTLTLAPDASGNVTATVTDWYGLTAQAYTSF